VDKRLVVVPGIKQGLEEGIAHEFKWDIFVVVENCVS
jgi:hypothetical protein